MASIADTLTLLFKVDFKGLSKGLDKARDNIQRTSGELSKGVDQVTGKAVSQLAGIARMVAAPLAGAMTIGSVIKSYFNGVAQVAQMTGAYSAKMEEWRKKRALLNRTTAEDVQLYKQAREAVTKFQIVMADLSAKLMRSVSPAFKTMVQWLDKISDWIDDHMQDIIRGVQVLAGVIATLLIPTFFKLAAAMLLNPITLIIGLIGLLALAIDDLVVWLRNGESAFDSLWSTFGTREEVMQKIQTAFDNIVKKLSAVWNALQEGITKTAEWFSETWTACNGTQRVVEAVSGAFDSFSQTLEDLGVIWDYIVDKLKTNGFLDDMAEAFDGTISFITGIFQFFSSFIQGIVGLVKGLLTGDWLSFDDAVKKSVNAAETAFKGLWKVVESVFNQIWQFIVDICGDIAKSITDALTIDTDKWIKRLNPANWFSSDEGEEGEKPQDWLDSLNPANWGRTNDSIAAAQNAERAQTQVNNQSKTLIKDNHATYNFNSPSADAMRRALQDTPGFDEGYVDQAVMAMD